MDDEFEKVDELEFNEICQSLENEGMVNSEFRNVYLLKKETPSFFRNLVCNFFHDARTVIYNLTTTLESSSVVNFDFLKNHCFKLKGSSACIGACTLVNGCSIFIEAVENKSKIECLEAVRNMKQAYHELDTKLKSLMKVEKEIVAAEERAYRQQQ
ncbi:hypothetical protein RDI58_026314 [Solanum bulbocastanum]|uniref:Histidine-containing phosphotransfer protein n=1 Tax=Solanum bulbocastanum TaxID=147425 RepID=A0AAN8SZY2_SOLBU